MIGTVLNLYLVRHGLTAWNIAGRYQGWSDIPLAREGKKQARQTAECFAVHRALHGLEFGAIYTSPLWRAQQTAGIIGEWLNIEPLVVPGLREMNGGAIEGLTEAEWQARYPELAPDWRDTSNLEFGWPGGETRRAFRARCLHTISSLLSQHAPSDHVIIVAHGGVIRSYVSSIESDGQRVPDTYDVANCSITQVQLSAPSGPDGEVMRAVGCLRSFNQVGHLREHVAATR
ncbi:MAG: histidine phosphatase family protein [Chloroflexia bacterium]